MHNHKALGAVLMNGYITKHLLPFILVFSLVLTMSPAHPAVAAFANVHWVTLVSRGTSEFKAVPFAPLEYSGKLPNTPNTQVKNTALLKKKIPRKAASPGSTALAIPVVHSSKVSTQTASTFSGWKGLTHYDQRLANNGNQWSLEPPDQGLCAGAGFVMEVVNDALAVYDMQGNLQKGVTDLNTFYGYPAAIDRTNVIYGPLLTDPKCLYDPSIGRWFLTILALEQDPASGSFTGVTHVDIAVSQGQDPTGSWFIYSLDTTDGDGTLPAHPGCPCLGDQPLIGYNQDALIVTTNEFSLAGTNFNGAQVYAISKQSLLKGKKVSVAHFDNLSLVEGPAYSLQPAVPNIPASLNAEPKGVEYFLSALQFNGVFDNRIALWALTGTETLGTPKPTVDLSYAVLTSEVYGMPPAANQKAGPIPLGDSNSSPENQISTNDDRMNQVQFDGKSLYAGLNTILSVNGKEQAGIAYFVVKPSMVNSLPVGQIASQGYVAVAKSAVMYPSIAVAGNGRAIMTFTLTGNDYYPSVAYSVLDEVSVVTIAANGTEPADGMTGYVVFGGDGIERWGDYSAAVSDGLTVWLAAEYIPGGPRTSLANWGTFVYSISP